MRTSARLAMLMTVLSVCAATGAEPIAAPRDLPPPVAEPLPELPPPPPYLGGAPIIRIDRYAIWQNYAVDHQGYFRPRVVATPYGAYYFVNGQPYPWLYVHPLNVMPYASD